MRRQLAVLFVTVGAIFGCRPQPDPWYRARPSVRFFDHRLSADRVLRVATPWQPTAQRLLQDVACQPITLNQARQYCECAPPAPGPAGWWLVRSVSQSPGSDSISVYDRDGELAIHRVGLGSGGIQVREAILVAPNRQPQNVYPTCGLAR